MPSSLFRSAGVRLAVQQTPPGMNSAAWLRTLVAIAVKAAESMSCTSALSSASLLLTSV